MSGNVQGALLYAKTEERITPDLDAKFGANKIMVKTLDLNCDFSKIKSQLDELALSIYSV
jgi:5-methylcytosine-specific restriction enzyme subunit McrC